MDQLHEASWVAYLRPNVNLLGYAYYSRSAHQGLQITQIMNPGINIWKECLLSI
jgi:hypothetical protein